jgi:flavodoxin/ferredoxin
MKVTMIYFSQTGNTRIVAETMAEAFREKGHITRTISLSKATPQDATTSDLLGIGTPCYSSQAPTPVKAFLRTLSHLDRQRAFAFATSGGSPGRVLYDVSHLLQNKGAEVIGGFITHGEVHHPAPCLIGRFPNHPNAEDLDGARRFAEAITEHLSAGKAGLVAESHPGTLKPMERFYNAVALLSTDTFLRRSLPEPKLDLTRCDKCQWCVYACPMHNITQQPYPILGPQCIRCYRCLTGCPQKAFNVDWRIGNIGVWMFYNVAFERWFGDVKHGESIYSEV